MRLSSIFTIAGTFVGAAILSWVAAGFSVTVIEDSSRSSVRSALDKEGMTWAVVDADGLQLFLAGTAPTEAMRFNALSAAGAIVDAERVIDQMLVEDAVEIAPPRFSVEILRNKSGISLIGLIPASTDKQNLLAEIQDAADGATVMDLLETADYPRADTWDDAVKFAVRALKKLPRSKISVEADRVAITTMADNGEAKLKLESELSRNVPNDVRLALEVSVPRPVVTPFTLRFVIEDGHPRFDACSVDTEESRELILNAAREAGLIGEADCTIALGVPTPQWGKAASQAISAMAELGGGSVTFADADISLLAVQGTPDATFDDVIGTLESDLPEVFSLHAVLPEPPDENAPAIPEFVVTLSPEGLVQIRGKLGSERLRDTVDSFARAKFSSANVYTKARVVEGLPNDWPMRVLTGLEALSFLSNGAVAVTPDSLAVTGSTGQKELGSVMAGFLTNKLGEGAHYEINVTYKEQLDPVANIPTPEECAADIAEILSERKISFEPGSSTIDTSGRSIMDDIGEVLKLCGDIRIEIGGHTDSQGRETMNQQLSQARAFAVLDALRARRVLTSSFSAKGYGETSPVADNGTEEGREANRRIEFRLITPEAVVEEETGLESTENQGEEGQTVTEDTQESTTDEQN